MVRLRRFWMPIVIGTALLIGIVVVAAMWPGFDPRRVVVSGNHRVARGEILARAAIAPHESIWLQSPRSIARRIEAIPYIDTATVHRIAPATVTIAVAERAPFAVVQSGDRVAVVDRALRALAPPAVGASWPTFVIGPGARLAPGDFVATHEAVQLREAYDAMTARGVVPVRLAFDRYGGLVAMMRDGLRLMLGGQNDMGRKLSLVDAILAQVIGHQRRVAAIDLRAPATPVVVYR